MRFKVEIMLNMIIKTVSATIVLGFLLNQNFAQCNQWEELETQIGKSAPKMAAACVSIRTANGGWGSGVIVNRVGLIFSAAHVYKKTGERVVVFLSKGRRTGASVLRMDAGLDIAVLKLDVPASGIEPARIDMESTKKFHAGSALIAAGHASGYRAERCSPLRVGFGFFEPGRGKIYSTCRITAGDSGGPLYDQSGSLRAIHHTMDRTGKFSAHIPVVSFFKKWPDLIRSLA